MTAAAPMQGTYIPQYTPVPPTAVSIEVSLSLCYRKRVGEIHLSHTHCGPHTPRNPYGLCGFRAALKLEIASSVYKNACLYLDVPRFSFAHKIS